MDKNIAFIKQNILTFLDSKGISKVDFFEKTKISASSFKASGLKSELGGDKIKSIIATYPDINPAWLLTGEGNMLLSENTKEQLVERKPNLIPFYEDVNTMGGMVGSSFKTDVAVTKPSATIDAGDWFPNATSAIRHYGDSMIEYPSGSILALRAVQDSSLLVWGRVYVIETSEFRVTKRLQPGLDEDYIIAHSSNREKYDDGSLVHAPIKIERSLIRRLYLVLGCVSKHDSNGAVDI